MHKTNISEKDNLKIESKFTQLVSQVKPNPDFVDQLKAKLVNSPYYYGRRERSVRWFFLLSGLLIGLLLFLLGRRVKNEKDIPAGVIDESRV